MIPNFPPDGTGLRKVSGYGAEGWSIRSTPQIFHEDLLIVERVESPGLDIQILQRIGILAFDSHSATKMISQKSAPRMIVALPFFEESEISFAYYDGHDKLILTIRLMMETHSLPVWSMPGHSSM